MQKITLHDADAHKHFTIAQGPPSGPPATPEQRAADDFKSDVFRDFPYLVSACDASVHAAEGVYVFCARTTNSTHIS